METSRRITRVGHRKSRNGCTRCKARRVKCNETAPCYNCARHGVQCSLSRAIRQSSSQGSTAPYRTLDAVNSERPAQVSALQNSDGSARSATSEIQEMSSASVLRLKINEARQLMLEVSESLDSSPMASDATASATTDSPENRHGHEIDNWGVRDQMQSLRLLHHYYKSAYSLQAHEPATAELWRTTVPKIAFDHGYLMHGILALSALHYAHTNTAQNNTAQRQHYMIVSAHYQQLALKFFSGNIHAINNDNCEAYFLLSSIIFLLFIFSIGHADNSGEQPSPGTVTQSFVFLQGARDVLNSQSLQRWAVGNSLAVLLSPRPWYPSNHEVPTRLQTRIIRVRQLAMEQSCFYDDKELKSNYLAAIDLLQTTSSWADPATSEGRRRIWYWPINLSQAFLHSLRTGQQLALMILSLFAELVRPYEAGNWLLQGWSNSVLRMVGEKLDQQWRNWLDWPRERET